jgi:5-methylcytosine-specific restriction endonuclease McrA
MKKKNSVVARELASQQNWLCHYCAFLMTDSSAKSKNLDSAVTTEHLIPRSKQGSNAPSNLKAACKLCNNLRKCSNHIDFKLVVTTLLLSPKMKEQWHNLDSQQRKELNQEIQCSLKQLQLKRSQEHQEQ